MDDKKYRRLRGWVLFVVIVNILLSLLLLGIAISLTTHQKVSSTQPLAAASTVLPTHISPIVLPSPLPSPTASLAPTASPLPVVTRMGFEHTVREGETLWMIADRYYGSGLAWMTLLDNNPQYSGQEELKAGELVFIPRPEGGMPNYITTPVADAIPIRASSYTLNGVGYDSDQQNINCNDDCSNLALAAFDPAFYGRAAACPPEWLGTSKTGRLTIVGLGTFYCLDAGTLIRFTCRQVSGYGDDPICLYEVDFLCETFPPPFHGRLFYDWRVDWVPLNEAVLAAKMGEKYCD